MAHKSTIYTGGKKTPGLRFQGEMMQCIMCGKEEKSDPAVESDWTCVEAGSAGYYVCPDELPKKGAVKQQYTIAWNKILRRVEEQTRADWLRVARWTNIVADELDKRFGAHPMIPRSETLKIARELIDASQEPDKDGLYAMLEKVVNEAFKGGSLDK